MNQENQQNLETTTTIPIENSDNISNSTTSIAILPITESSNVDQNGSLLDLDQELPPSYESLPKENNANIIIDAKNDIKYSRFTYKEMPILSYEAAVGHGPRNENHNNTLLNEITHDGGQTNTILNPTSNNNLNINDKLLKKLRIFTIILMIFNFISFSRTVYLLIQEKRIPKTDRAYIFQLVYHFNFLLAYFLLPSVKKSYKPKHIIFNVVLVLALLVYLRGFYLYVWLEPKCVVLNSIN